MNDDLELVFGGPAMFLLNWIALTIGYAFMITVVGGLVILGCVSLYQKLFPGQTKLDNILKQSGMWDHPDEQLDIFHDPKLR